VMYRVEFPDGDVIHTVDLRLVTVDWDGTECTLADLFEADVVKVVAECRKGEVVYCPLCSSVLTVAKKSEETTCQKCNKKITIQVT